MILLVLCSLSCENGGGDGKVELCHDKQSWLKSQSQWLKLGFNPTTMLQHLLALVVTHDLEMNLNTIVTVMVAMATTFWCGFRCGVLWVKRKSVGKAKVVIYPKGKKYHCHSCKQPARTSSATDVTIVQAEEQGMTPCMCAVCEKAFIEYQNRMWQKIHKCMWMVVVACLCVCLSVCLFVLDWHAEESVLSWNN